MNNYNRSYRKCELNFSQLFAIFNYLFIWFDEIISEANNCFNNLSKMIMRLEISHRRTIDKSFLRTKLHVTFAITSFLSLLFPSVCACSQLRISQRHQKPHTHTHTRGTHCARARSAVNRHTRDHLSARMRSTNEMLNAVTILYDAEAKAKSGAVRWALRRLPVGGTSRTYAVCMWFVSFAARRRSSIGARSSRICETAPKWCISRETCDALFSITSSIEII